MEKTKSHTDNMTIGGHFSALLETRSNSLPGRYSYESARSALYAVLRAVKSQRVFVPHYVCEAVIVAVKAAGYEVDFYSINDAFEIADEVVLEDGDLILLVNYFGLCRPQIYNQLALFPKNSVVVDCSQAYFEDPFDCLATIYSPRKFLPAPDGGVVHTSLELSELEPDESGSMDRYRYLLERVTGEPESSRGLYLESEKQLEEPSLRAMSGFTKKLIEVSDYDFIKKRRSVNWTILSQLDSVNNLKFDVGRQTPICYPLMVGDAERLREELRKKRVFSPLYWPNVQFTNSHEKALIKSTLFLPIDHRYGETHMAMLLNYLKENSVFF